MRNYFVYILTNKYNTVFYTGITNNLGKRVWEHKNKIIEGFTSKYNIYKLIYYEVFENPYEAILREKQIKNYRREKKLSLVRKLNPKLNELGDFSLRSK